MDELRRLRGLLVTALTNVDDLAVSKQAAHLPAGSWQHAFDGSVLHALEQLREVITAIEPAYEVALLRCEREVQRD